MRRALLVFALLVFALAACAAPTAPETRAPSCWLEQRLTGRDGSVWLVRAYYAVCPDTS